MLRPLAERGGRLVRLLGILLSGSAVAEAQCDYVGHVGFPHAHCGVGHALASREALG